MKDIIFYFLKSGLWIGIFGMIYWFFLRKETFYKFNRFFLLFGLIASFVLPFFIFKYTIKLDITPFITTTQVTTMPKAQSFEISPWQILLGLHLIGSLVLLFKHLRGIFKLKKLILRNGFLKESGTKIIHTQEVDATFSIFNYIFMDSSSSISEIERRMIYEHERAHISQYHWIDLMIVHIVCIFQWFNPFIWIYLNSIKQNHEFLADQEVLKNGNSPAVYRAALINYTLKTPVFAFANAFAQYNKFKRIDMMKKESSNPKKKWTVLLLVPALVAFLWIFAEPEYIFAKNLNPQKLDFNFTFNTEDADITKDSVKVVSKVVVTCDETNEHSAEVGNVTLQDIDIETDSVVVVGYGIQRKDLNLDEKTKWELTGNLTSIVNIHNVKSGEKPLFIVDGKELDSDIENLNPDQIESMSVLKDQSASQIYGEKGENGVVLITTKKEGLNTGQKYVNPDTTNVIVVATKKNDAIKNLKSSTIKIRGLGDLSSSLNRPLIVVDGEVYTKGLDSVNHQDIESISVLKDAAATGIYGGNATSGVIVITTKNALKKTNK